MKTYTNWIPFSDNLKKELLIVDNELEKGIESLGLLTKAHVFGLLKTKGFASKQVLQQSRWEKLPSNFSIKPCRWTKTMSRMS